MTKILYLTPYFCPDIGGIETLSMQVLPELQARGFHITVATSQGPLGRQALSYWQDIPVHRYPIREAFDTINLRQILSIKRDFLRLKQETQPELVHVNFGWTHIAHFHLETKSEVPTLTTLHTGLGDVAFDRDILIAKLLDASGHVTAVSQAVLSSTLAFLPSIAEKISLLYNGISLPATTSTCLSLEPLRILCIGRLTVDKGFDIALKAFAKVLAGHPRARLTLAGNGPARRELLALIQALRLEEAVDVMGWVEPADVAVLMSQHSMVWIPSRWAEPFCLVAVEAALMARPVIASRVGGLVETVIDGETGLHFDNENVEDLVRKTLILLADPQHARRMGLAGQRQASKRFSKTRFVDSLADLYHDLITSSKASRSE